MKRTETKPRGAHVSFIKETKQTCFLCNIVSGTRGHDIVAVTLLDTAFLRLFFVISLRTQQLVAADMPVCAHIPPIVSSGLRVTSGTFMQHTHTLPLHASGESEVLLDQNAEGRSPYKASVLQSSAGPVRVLWGESGAAAWKEQEAAVLLLPQVHKCSPHHYVYDGSLCAHM